MSGLTLEVYRPGPEDASPVLTPPTGGWTGGTYSFIVVAWYSATETDLSMAALVRAGQAEWNGVVVAANDRVVIDWSAVVKPPDHYAIYFQNLAAFDPEEIATKTGNAAWNATSLEIASEVAGATLVFGDDPPNVVLNPVMDMSAVKRQRTGVAYDGSLVDLNLGSDTLVERLDVSIVGMSATHPEAKMMLGWLRNSVPLKCLDAVISDPSVDPYVSNYYGKIIDTDWSGSRGKRNSGIFNLTFAVEAEDYT